MEFTAEELKNLVVLLDSGARAVASQNDLEAAGNVMHIAGALKKKIENYAQKLEPENDVYVG